MASRLFHSIVVCGAALGALPLSCAGEGGRGDPAPPDAGASDVGDGGGGGQAERCREPDGGCKEHCPPTADGRCLDPCFVHTEVCSPDCLLPDGGCGWPPTK
jgi:hypothetical protein